MLVDAARTCGYCVTSPPWVTNSPSAVWNEPCGTHGGAGTSRPALLNMNERMFDARSSPVGTSLGAPGGPGSVDVGAMTFPPQLDIVSRHVEQARSAGARVTTGGRRRAGAGRFYEPTVLADVDHTMSAMTEETFGPTLPIMKVADADEAVRMANDSVYGLGASVWTKDAARGEQIAARLESGYACVNDINVNYFAYELPMGGWKESGLGVRHGAAGIRKYTRQQAILVTRLPMKREVHYFPYKARTTRLLGRLVKLMYGRGRR